MISIFTNFGRIIGNYTGLSDASYVVAVIILAAFFVIAKIVNFLFGRVFVSITSKTKTDIDDDIIKILNTPIFYSILLFGIYQAFDYLAILSEYAVDFLKVVNTVAIIIWISAFSKLVKIVVLGLGMKFAGRTKSALDNELMPLFQKFSAVIIYFAGIMFLLQVWGINITPLLASAGIAGFVIAFAAQDTISHLFGGVSIYFDKPFKRGDRVQLETGEVGDVMEIGIRSTRIKTFDETVVVIPNSKIANSKIINYNQPGSRIKAKVSIGVAYGSDISKVKNILLDIAKSIEEVEKEPSPSVYLTALGDFSLNFLVITWVDSPTKQFSVQAEMNELIYERFNKEGIKIPFPTREVYLNNNIKS